MKRSAFALDFEFAPHSLCSIEGWGAAIAAAATVAGGAISAAGAESAASTEAGAEMQAAQIQQQEEQSIQQLESPFVTAGTGALSQLQYYLGEGTTTPGAGVSTTNPMTGTGSGYGSLNTPFTASYMQQYSPAYQFQLQQGIQGTLNSAAPGQGALSGAAQQALVGYNQNYANTAFNNAFNQYQTQQQNTYSRLSGVAQLGQSAASQTATSGTQLAGNVGSAVAGAGASQAAGTVGAANAIGGSLSSLGMLGAYYGLNSQGSPGNGLLSEVLPATADNTVPGLLY